MDTKKLRQKILDLAIRGKLVPQDPNDEPASVLLERIRAEKEQLIKEGKIKRSKKSAATDKSHYENVPFEIPESWCWCTLSELCIFLSRGKSPKYSDERLFPVFAQKCNLKDGGISLGQARFLDPSTIGTLGFITTFAQFSYIVKIVQFRINFVGKLSICGIFFTAIGRSFYCKSSDKCCRSILVIRHLLSYYLI